VARKLEAIWEAFRHRYFSLDTEGDIRYGPVSATNIEESSAFDSCEWCINIYICVYIIGIYIW
jgi:hypothetical protein